MRNRCTDVLQQYQFFVTALEGSTPLLVFAFARVSDSSVLLQGCWYSLDDQICQFSYKFMVPM